jgi:ribonuclease P protein component
MHTLGAAPALVQRELRLRHRKDFDNVFSRGRSWNNRLLVLRAAPNEQEHNRYGFVTSKRLGGSVVRNRVRRRLREALRALPLEPSWDVVVSAKTPAAGADYHELKRAVADLLARAGILKTSANGETTA